MVGKADEEVWTMKYLQLIEGIFGTLWVLCVVFPAWCIRQEFFNMHAEYKPHARNNKKEVDKHETN
jgi:hypothetical protein